MPGPLHHLVADLRNQIDVLTRRLDRDDAIQPGLTGDDERRRGDVHGIARAVRLLSQEPDPSGQTPAASAMSARARDIARGETEPRRPAR